MTTKELIMATFLFMAFLLFSFYFLQNIRLRCKKKIQYGLTSTLNPAGEPVRGLDFF
jgi:hypothetical protein